MYTAHSAPGDGHGPVAAPDAAVETAYVIQLLRNVRFIDAALQDFRARNRCYVLNAPRDLQLAIQHYTGVKSLLHFDALANDLVCHAQVLRLERHLAVSSRIAETVPPYQAASAKVAALAEDYEAYNGHNAAAAHETYLKLLELAPAIREAPLHDWVRPAWFHPLDSPRPHPAQRIGYVKVEGAEGLLEHDSVRNTDFTWQLTPAYEVIRNGKPVKVDGLKTVISLPLPLELGASVLTQLAVVAVLADVSVAAGSDKKRLALVRACGDEGARAYFEPQTDRKRAKFNAATRGGVSYTHGAMPVADRPLLTIDSDQQFELAAGNAKLATHVTRIVQQKVFAARDCLCAGLAKKDDVYIDYFRSQHSVQPTSRALCDLRNSVAHTLAQLCRRVVPNPPSTFVGDSQARPIGTKPALGTLGREVAMHLLVTVEAAHALYLHGAFPCLVRECWYLPLTRNDVDGDKETLTPHVHALWTHIEDISSLPLPKPLYHYGADPSPTTKNPAKTRPSASQLTPHPGTAVRTTPAPPKPSPEPGWLDAPAGTPGPDDYATVALTFDKPHPLKVTRMTHQSFAAAYCAYLAKMKAKATPPPPQSTTTSGSLAPSREPVPVSAFSPAPPAASYHAADPHAYLPFKVPSSAHSAASSLVAGHEFVPSAAHPQ